jgi:hypothetical protein
VTVADDVLEKWRKAKHRFRAEPGSTFKHLPERWEAAVGVIRSALTAHIGSDEVAARFAVPEDYAAFMRLVGGARYRERGLGFRLLSPEQVAKEFCSNYKMYVVDRIEGRDPADSGFWLWVGTWSDKHDFFLCGDRAHPLFGYVVEMHDDHPYIDGAGSGTGSDDSPSFLGFLDWLARNAND